MTWDIGHATRLPTAFMELSPQTPNPESSLLKWLENPRPPWPGEGALHADSQGREEKVLQHGGKHREDCRRRHRARNPQFGMGKAFWTLRWPIMHKPTHMLEDGSEEPRRQLWRPLI